MSQSKPTPVHAWSREFLLGMWRALEACRAAESTRCRCDVCTQLRAFAVVLGLMTDVVEMDVSALRFPGPEMAESYAEQARTSGHGFDAVYWDRLATQKRAGAAAVNRVIVAPADGLVAS